MVSYGPKDVRDLQVHLRRDYPDRLVLAKVYRLLRTPTGQITLGEASAKLEAAGLIGALPAALGIFAELGLWSTDGEAIRYLPEPAHKLDLEQAVLYNRITKIRDQAALYLQAMPGRGFLQDGFERQN